MEPPPSRYRVVEKDGRLVVIDNGEPVESLIKHSHDVVTPADRHAEPHGDGRTRSPKIPSPTGSARASSIPLPIGPDGQSVNVPLTGQMMGKAFGSVFLLFLLFAFLGFLFIPLVIALIIANAINKENKLFKRMFRGWLRWVATS